MSPDPREHFLSGLVIAFISSSHGMKDHDGYVDGHRILEEMQTFSFTEDQIRFALRILASRRLIETPYSQYREIEVPESEPAEHLHYRATSIGIYHLRFWMGSFAYLDATSTDTPIFDSVERGEVFELGESFEIADRYKKTWAFRRYLEHQWDLANITATYFDFAALIRSQEEGFRSAERAIPRRSKRPVRS